MLVGIGGGLLALLLLIIATDLQQPLIRTAQDMVGYGGPHSDEATGSRDLFHSGAPIGGRRGGVTYGEYDIRRDQAAVTHFFGFGCGGDCREHEAGYRWAVRHAVSDQRACAELTWAFMEGCVAYAARQK